MHWPWHTISLAAGTLVGLTAGALKWRRGPMRRLGDVLARDLRDPAQALIFQVDLLLRAARPGGEAHISAKELRRLRDAARRVARVASDLLEVTAG